RAECPALGDHAFAAPHRVLVEGRGGEVPVNGVLGRESGGFQGSTGSAGRRGQGMRGGRGVIAHRARGAAGLRAAGGGRARSAGSRSCSSATARRTLSTPGCFTEPKFENESIATRGSIPSRHTKLAVAEAISASVSASGSMLTVQSAKKYVCCGNTSM